MSKLPPAGETKIYSKIQRHILIVEIAGGTRNMGANIGFSSWEGKKCDRGVMGFMGR